MHIQCSGCLDSAACWVVSISLRQRTHCTARHCIAPHCTALHFIALHCSALHCIVLHVIELHNSALSCLVLNFDLCTALHWAAQLCTLILYTALHCTAEIFTALHCTANISTALNCSAQLRVLHGPEQHSAQLCCALPHNCSVPTCPADGSVMLSPQSWLKPSGNYWQRPTTNRFPKHFLTGN